MSRRTPTKPADCAGCGRPLSARNTSGLCVPCRLAFYRGPVAECACGAEHQFLDLGRRADAPHVRRVAGGRGCGHSGRLDSLRGLRSRSAVCGIRERPRADVRRVRRIAGRSQVSAMRARMRAAIPARRRSRNIRETLYGRQGGNCSLCRVHFEPRNLTLDHVIPRAHGGADDDDNLQLLCGACNSTKGAGTMSEAIARLRARGELRP